MSPRQEPKAILKWMGHRRLLQKQRQKRASSLQSLRSQFHESWGLELPKVGSALSRRADLEVDVGYAFERCVGYSKEPHTHPRLTIAKPRNLSAVSFHFNNKCEQHFELDKSQILLFPANLLHSQHSNSKVWDVFALYPNDSLLSEELKGVQSPVAVTSTLKLDHLFDRVFSHLVLKLNNAKRVHDDYEECLSALSKELARSASSSTLKEAELGATEGFELLEFLEVNLFRNITTSEIAAHAQRSEASLFRDFEKRYKTTPKAYIRSRRFEEAANLLSDPAKKHTLRVEDVCFLVGYEDVATFSKTFKEIFGLSPKQFRNV